MNIPQLIKELERDEGFRPYAYQDSLGYLTIGIGRLCDKRMPRSGLTLEEARYLLNNDINKRLVQLQAALPWIIQLSDGRQRALMNMAFQLGINGLLGFKNTLQYIKQGDFLKAGENAKLSKWYQQTPARAQRVIDLIIHG